MLSADDTYTRTLGEQITKLKSRITNCAACGNFTETDPCPICADPSRDRSVICVVEQPQDVATLESTKEFHGLYHVLRGVISPLDGIGPKELGLDRLAIRVREHGVQEVILATNPTVEGDSTALYIVRMLEGAGVKTSRLALGLPVGGDLEYADRLTLVRSLKGRTAL
jgi:recombination protein RecR